MELDLVGARLTLHLQPEQLELSLAPGIYDRARGLAFLRGVGQFCRMRLGLALAEPTVIELAERQGLRFGLPRLDEAATLRLTRILRYLAARLEAGDDPFSTLASLEWLDSRWPELHARLAGRVEGLRAFPDPAGHLLLLAEQPTTELCLGALLLLDPAAESPDRGLRLLLQLRPATAHPPARLAAALSRVSGLVWLAATRPTDPAPPDPLWLGLETRLAGTAGPLAVDEQLIGLRRRLAELLQATLADPAGLATTAAPADAGAGPPAGTPSPTQARAGSPTAGPSSPGLLEDLSTPAPSPRPSGAPAAWTPGPATPLGSAAALGPLRLEDLRRARELGLPPPPAWPEQLLPRAERSGQGAPGRVPAAGAAFAASPLPGLGPQAAAGPAADLLGIPFRPDLPGGNEASSPAPDGSEGLADDVPVDLVLVSAGPFPGKLQRVLAILLSVDYPRAGELLSRAPTMLLRGTPAAVARRYGQVLRQVGARYRIERRPR